MAASADILAGTATFEGSPRRTGLGTAQTDTSPGPNPNDRQRLKSIGAVMIRNVLDED